MGQCFKGSDSVMGRLFEHSHQQVQRLRIQFFVFFSLKGDVAGPVLRKHFIVSLPWECTDTQKQNMEDESQAENIADGVILCLHIFDVDHLRSHIAWSSASNKQIFLCFCELCKTKISNDALPTALISEDEVFGFEIAVHDAFCVHFLESLKDGIDDELNLRGFELVFGLNLVIQLASFQKLHHDVEGVLRFEHLMEFHAELVAEVAHYLNLLDQTLLSLVLAVSCLLRKGLNCEVFTAFQFLCQVYRGKITLTDFFLRFELFMEASLIELSFQNFSACLEVGVRFEGVGRAFFLFFEGDGTGRECESVLEVEIKVHHLSSSFRTALDETLVVQGERNFTLGGVGGAGEQQLAGI